MARALDRKHQRRVDDAGSVSRSRSIDGTRMLRLHPARGFDLCRTELEELARDLSQERHVGAAPGAVGRRHDDGGGHVTARNRPDALDLRVSSVSGGAHPRHARSGVIRSRRLEHGDRQLRSVGDELRPGPAAPARSALRDGRGICRDRQAAVRFVGARRHRRRPQIGRADRSHQGPYDRFRRQILSLARAAELRAPPRRASPSSRRPAARTRAGPSRRSMPTRSSHIPRASMR